MPRISLRSRLGFTFFELMVVIVIIGILSAVAVPRVSRGVRQSRLSNAQAAVTAELGEAVSHAARRRRPVVVDYVASTAQLGVRFPGVPGAYISRLSLGPTSEYAITTVSMTRAGAAVDTVLIVPSALTQGGCVVLRVGTGRDTLARRVALSRAGIPRALQSGEACP